MSASRLFDYVRRRELATVDINSQDRVSTQPRSCEHDSAGCNRRRRGHPFLHTLFYTQEAILQRGRSGAQKPSDSTCRKTMRRVRMASA